MTSAFGPLTPSEEQVVADVLSKTAPIGAPPKTLGQLLGRWKALVKEVEARYELSAYDYTNDLTVRDRLQRVLDGLPEALAQRLERDIRVLDHRFQEATEELETPLSDRANWWWRRRPRLRGTEFDETA